MVVYSVDDLVESLDAKKAVLMVAQRGDEKAGLTVALLAVEMADDLALQTGEERAGQTGELTAETKVALKVVSTVVLSVAMMVAKRVVMTDRMMVD